MILKTLITNGRSSGNSGYIRILLVGVALSGLASAACLSGIPKTVSDPSAPFVPRAADVTLPPKTEPRNAWASIAARLEQADREADRAVAARVAELDAYFAERKRGAHPFAREILGFGHKLGHADALGGRALDRAGKAFSDFFKTEEQRHEEALMWRFDPGENDDPYTIEARHVFDRRVMKGTDFMAATDSAATGFIRDLQSLEARLLVDLRADLADVDLDEGRLAPVVAERSAGWSAVDAALADTLSVARTDLGVTIAEQSVSFVVGNKVGGVLAGGATNGLWKLVLNLTGNLAADEVLGSVKQQTGYNAEADVAKRVVRALDNLRNRLVEGDARAVKAHFSLRDWRRGHPDRAVRTACREATDAIEHSGALGLKQSLRAMYYRRAESRRAALSRLILGSDAGAQTVTSPTFPPSDQILKYAQQCAAFWKGKKS